MPKTQTKPSSKPSADPLAAEERAFHQQRPQLMKRFRGQYVGFYHGRFVDHDDSDEILAACLFKKLGDVSFYIARLEDSPTVCEVPSPELAN
jgi:hypothetical protein